MSQHKFRNGDKTIYKKAEKQYPVFSFQYMTQNDNKYSFSFFGKSQFRDGHGAYEGLIKRLCDLERINLDTLLLQPKNTGLETIDISQFHGPFKRIVKENQLRNEQAEVCKLTVFRFKNAHNKESEYRLICKQCVTEERLFYIIGFDFDFSAYDH